MVGIIPSRPVMTVTVGELNYQKKGSCTLMFLRGKPWNNWQKLKINGNKS